MSDALTKEERELRTLLEDRIRFGLYPAESQQVGKLVATIDRLCVELTRARHENERLEASIRGNVAKIGEKHRENDALRKRVEKLEAVAKAAEQLFAESAAPESQMSTQRGRCLVRDALSALRSES